MANKILVLDAGHGLNTAGKRTLNGSQGVVREWTINNNVCNHIASILKDYNVTIYRTDDTTGKTDVSLSDRVKKTNTWKPNLFISIHHNANASVWGSHGGTEVYWHTKGTAEDKKVASMLAPELASKTGLRNRGVKQASFAVLGCSPTAILVEGGFMDSTTDYDVITSNKGQQAYAEAVAEVVIKYLGLKKIVTSQPTTLPSTGFKVGDKVKVKTTATHYATGQSIKSFVKGSTYEVTKVDGNKLLLSSIDSWVWDYDVENASGSTTSPTTNTASFTVKIVCSTLNIRKNADFNSSVVGVVNKGDVFTIVEEKNGLGKLKSGAGWISMGSSYVQKM